MTRGRFAVKLLLGFALAGLALRCAAAGGPSRGEPPRGAELHTVWERATPSGLPLSIAADALDRPYLYVALKEGGLLVLDVSNAGDPPSEVAALERDQLADLDAMHVVQQGDALFVTLGSFFDVRGSKAGLAIVTVTDPRSPRVSALWTSDDRQGGASSVLVDGDTAYLSAMAEGVFVFDVRDRSAIRPLSRVELDPDFPRANPNAVQRPNARGVAIRGDLLFVAYDAGGLRVVDVADKTAPREIGRYINGRMGAKQQAYNHVVLGWPYAYVAVDYCGLEVVDVSHPTEMRQVGWWNPWRCEAPTNLWLNSPGHTNQLALDNGRVFLSAGDAELQVVDVADPHRPRSAASHGRPRDGRGTWGMTLADETVYLTYIRTVVPFQGTWSGIRALSRANRKPTSRR